MYTYRLESGLLTSTKREVPLREPYIKNILKLPNKTIIFTKTILKHNILMYTCLLVGRVLLSPSVGVMSPLSPPCEVNIGNLLENYNYMLMKNPI